MGNLIARSTPPLYAKEFKNLNIMKCFEQVGPTCSRYSILTALDMVLGPTFDSESADLKRFFQSCPPRGEYLDQSFLGFQKNVPYISALVDIKDLYPHDRYKYHTVPNRAHKSKKELIALLDFINMFQEPFNWHKHFTSFTDSLFFIDCGLSI